MAEEVAVQQQADQGFADSTMRYFGQMQPQQLSDEIRRWQLDPEELLLRIDKFLRRQMWEASQKKYVSIKGVPPMANELGIQTILSYLTALLDPRSITLSNFEEDDVNRLAKQARHAIRDIIILRYQDFGIMPDYIPYIVDACDSMVFGVLRRAYMGGERRSQTQSHHTLEQVRSLMGDTGTMASQKKGFFFK